MAGYLRPHIKGAQLDYLRDLKGHKRLVSQAAVREKEQPPVNPAEVGAQRESIYRDMSAYLKFLEEKGLNSQRDGIRYNPLVYYVKWLTSDNTNPNPEKDTLNKLALKKILKIIADSLVDLSKKNPRAARVVIMYYFGDMTMKEIGKVLNISEGRVNHIITGYKDTVGALELLEPILKRKTHNPSGLIRYLSDNAK